MHKELLRGGTDRLTLSLSEHGRPVKPSSCHVRISHLGSLLEEGDAPDGVYTPSAATVGQARQDCTAEWDYTLDGQALRRAELFDVVLFRLEPVLSEAELLREAPGLLSSERVYRGLVAEATGADLTDRSLIGTREDWTGAVLALLSGAQAGTQFIVTAFDPLTGKLTYPAAQAAQAGDSFMLRRSYQAELDGAWGELYDRLLASCAAAPGGLGERGSRPFLVMTPDRLRRPHLFLALEKIYRGIATDTSGADWARAEHYAKAFDQAWNGLRLVFASPDNASVATPEGERSPQWGFGR